MSSLMSSLMTSYMTSLVTSDDLGRHGPPEFARQDDEEEDGRV